jgi:hypothetical protein
MCPNITYTNTQLQIHLQNKNIDRHYNIKSADLDLLCHVSLLILRLINGKDYSKKLADLQIHLPYSADNHDGV